VRVNFGRRLAFFFVLLVVVPMLALLSILLFVSEDAREGKADARVAAGVETAIAVYEDDLRAGRRAATRFARNPALSQALISGDEQRLLALTRAALQIRGLVALEVLSARGSQQASAGNRAAIAFGEVRLADAGRELGMVRASTTAPRIYATQVKHLTEREVVVSRANRTLAGTVPPPESLPGEDETADVEIDGKEYRARQHELDPGRDLSVLVLGPPKEGGLLALGRPAAALLVLFLGLAVFSAWMLARALGMLHGRVAQLAVTDPLTGLWNRRRMSEILAREFERQKRFGRPFSLLIVDVDDFKLINDQHGHPQGDAVLQDLGRLLDGELRAIDDAVRYGGDEFALVLSETRGEGAYTVADRIRRHFNEHPISVPGDKQLPVSLSIGIATVPGAADSPVDLVQAADAALLRAKRTGKNRVERAPNRAERAAGRA
jgi:diguanylate cyclase (GGDEF)-like protein